MASSCTVRKIPAVLAKCQARVVARTSRRLASTSAPQTQNPAYPLYPSVIQLLHEKGIPESEVSKIPASGPKGRLLKGDVLAYLGLIASDYPASQASRIEKLAHLDLSNIKIAPPPAPAAPEPAPAAETPVARTPPTMSIAVSISLSTVLAAQRKLQESVGVTFPLSAFLARATDLANDDLPLSPNAKQSASEIFDELLGAAPIKASRGEYIPELNVAELSAEAQPVQTVKEDLIDFLSGASTSTPKRTARVSPTETFGSESALNVFSLTVPVAEEKRARTFLERIKTLLTVEPARLVI
ncbi:putative pyruvate dehydrogenase complex component Pdx1 [Aspergillus undulatus]|uniref:putative pyruvate dehydrogenase complex component Pdx1 n=1 Tax=Aspergillus undulatus TaxID=1810928 RepID=UPI003CCD5996